MGSESTPETKGLTWSLQRPENMPPAAGSVLPPEKFGEVQKRPWRTEGGEGAPGT